MDEVVVLTGPSGHLGKAMLISLLDCFVVIGISRSASMVQESLPAEFKHKYFPLDLDFQSTSAESVAGDIDKLLSLIGGRLVGFVNNAFFSYPSSALAIDKATVAECAEGLFGYWIRLLLLVAPRMAVPASVVNISSMYAHVSPRPSVYETASSVNPLVYGAMKSALVQASRYLSSHLGPKGIRVNSVSFGPFPSESVQISDPGFVSKLASHTHLNRVGQPREAGAIVKFLLLPDSSYVAGADIAVDGGWTAW